GTRPFRSTDSIKLHQQCAEKSTLAWCGLVQSPLGSDIAHLGGPDDALVGDAHRSQWSLKIVCPEIEELDEPWEPRCEIVVLPDECLEDVAVVRHPIHDFRGREAPAPQ